MYTDFFHLREEPFQVTPDPRYLFLSKVHKRALDQLADGVRRRKGFIEMVGGVGTGKTLLCRELVQTLSPEMDIAYLFYPIINEEALYYAILHKWGISVPENMPSPLLVERIQEVLEERFASGRNALIILDEAQNLSIDLLERLRLLSNLETTSEKLLQILFAGQPEFHTLLKSGKIPQLDQRIRVRVFLEPLDRAMLPLYVYHRLNVAGADGTLSFSPEALEKISRYSRGIPRMINAICEKALEEASLEGIFNIDAASIQRAEDGLEGRGTGRKKTFTPTKFSAFSRVAFAGIFLAFLVFSGWWLLRNNEKAPKLVKPVVSIAAAEKKLPETKKKHLVTGALEETSAVHLILYPVGVMKSFLESVVVIPPGEGLFWGDVRMAPRDIPRLSTPFLIHISKKDGTTGWGCFKDKGPGHFLAWQRGNWIEADQTAFSRWTGRCLIPYWLHPWLGGGKLLRQGNSNPAVWDVQRWLKDLGLFEGPTGRFNVKMVESVKLFQKQAGLKPDGVAGPQTLAFLFHWARSIEKNGNDAQTVEENRNDAGK